MNDRRAPIRRAQIARVPREQPVVPIQIFRRVLKLAIHRLVRLLQNLRAGRLRARIVRLHILNEDRQRLRPVATLRR